jgi:hypothetical protein
MTTPTHSTPPPPAAEDAPRTVGVRSGLYQREILYDRETRDYAMRLDGELVGFARTNFEAERTLDQLVFELLSAHYWREAQA